MSLDTSLLCIAIRDKRVITMVYAGHRRIVEPYIHGNTSAGIEVLLGFQRQGGSTSGYRSSWRTFHVAKISCLELTNIAFLFQQESYHPTAREVSTIHCQV